MVTGAALPTALPEVPLALLVDRDADTRRMYAEFLQKQCCEIDEAEDGREALAKALTHRPSIVITETRLRGIDGYELCSLLRSDTTTKDLPILFVTGDAFDEEIHRAQTVGADAVLVKPCLPETLLLEMQRLLHESRELRDRNRAVREELQAQIQRSSELLARSTAAQKRRMTLSRAHVRQQTTSPSLQPPALVCPTCDKPLLYTRSHIGGVNAQTSEQWDYYDCQAGCGMFQYRQRTRKLRKVT